MDYNLKLIIYQMLEIGTMTVVTSVTSEFPVPDLKFVPDIPPSQVDRDGTGEALAENFDNAVYRLQVRYAPR